MSPFSFCHVPASTHTSFQSILCTAAKVIFWNNQVISLSLGKPFKSTPYCGCCLPLSSQRSPLPTFCATTTLASLWILKHAKTFFYLKAFALPVILFSFGWLTLILQVSLNITSSGRPSLFSPCKTGHPSPTFYYRILFMSSTSLFIIKFIIFIFIFIIVILLVSCLPGPLWTTTSSSFLISLFISESLVRSTMLGI